MVKKQYKRLEIGLILIILLTLMGAGVYIFYNLELQNKPIVKDRLQSSDYAYFYDFYITSTPAIEERPYYGNADAPVNIIAFLDINSDDSRYFIQEIFPQLDEEFISTGKAKYYHKNFVTIEDFISQKDNFVYAVALHCVNAIDKEKYYAFYFDLFNITGIKRINQLVEKHNISRQTFNECVKSNHFDDIKEDVSEVENFGISGINQRFYIGIHKDITVLDGIAKYDKFRSTIRKYQFAIGD